MVGKVLKVRRAGIAGFRLATYRCLFVPKKLFESEKTMDVNLALLADSANISREGKLNLLGIFNLIYAQSFPAVHPNMHLVVSFSTTNAEAGRTKQVEIQFLGPDGNKIGSITGKFVVPKGEPGYPIQVNHIVPIPPLKFEKPGDYAFSIFVNEELKKEASLRVLPLKPAK